MSRSRTDLINATLERLQAVPRGSVPSAEDVAKLETFIDPMIADLQTRNISLEISGDVIPDEMYLHLIAILANHAKDDYGMDNGEWDRMRVAAKEAESKLFSVSRNQQRKPAKLVVERALMARRPYVSNI